MATKTSKTKTSATKTKAAPKTNARAANVAPKAKRAAAAVAHTAAKPFENVDVKTALFGAGAGALLGTLATKLIFFR